MIKKSRAFLICLTIILVLLTAFTGCTDTGIKKQSTEQQDNTVEQQEKQAEVQPPTMDNSTEMLQPLPKKDTDFIITLEEIEEIPIPKGMVRFFHDELMYTIDTPEGWPSNNADKEAEIIVFKPETERVTGIGIMVSNIENKDLSIQEQAKEYFNYASRGIESYDFTEGESDLKPWQWMQTFTLQFSDGSISLLESHYILYSGKLYIYSIISRDTEISKIDEAKYYAELRYIAKSFRLVEK